SSHHEEGPGQNEIDFRYSDALSSADNAMTFRTVVKTVAHRSGLFADFSPKPREDLPGNGFHINISLRPLSDEYFNNVLAGILEKIEEITLFLNPVEDSYKRLGKRKAPGYVSWSHENRSQLIRIPAAEGEYERAELRSADPSANPYLAFGLLIRAGLYGIEHKLALPEPADINLFKADPSVLKQFRKLPGSIEEAKKLAFESAFVKEFVPQPVLDIYCR
ncbi:MAG: type I glutamate--ammonia ligase, partial [Clostridia bacterium]|nr:type I glutamate--ammonia ligase [Clostridia bacterium]